MVYRFQNCISFGQNLLVSKLEYLKTIFSQENITNGIILPMIFFKMLAPVGLNHKIYRWRIEVNNIWPNRPLAIKLDSKHLFSPKMQP